MYVVMYSSLEKSGRLICMICQKLEVSLRDGKATPSCISVSGPPPASFQTVPIYEHPSVMRMRRSWATLESNASW